MKRTFESLQAGRGLAALAVVAHHSTLAARDYGGQPLSWVRFGYLGVDFFFVLSGFIIYHSTVGRDRTLGSYALARFRRVFLPYWPIAAGLALLYICIPATAGRHHWTWLATLTLAPVPQNSALTVAWTLQHEVLFYCVFGLLYFGRILPLGLVAWGVAIAFLGGSMIPFKAINFEFLMGIVCAATYRRMRPELMLLAPVPILLWIHWGFHRSQSALIGLAFALLIASLANLEERRGIPVMKPLVALGAASYSLYLVHPPLVMLTAHLVPSSAILAAAIAVSLAGGFAYHHGVEMQLLRRSILPPLAKSSVCWAQSPWSALRSATVRLSAAARALQP